MIRAGFCPRRCLSGIIKALFIKVVGQVVVIGVDYQCFLKKMLKLKMSERQRRTTDSVTVSSR